MDKYINASELLRYLQEKYDEEVSLSRVTEDTLKEKEHIEYAINLLEDVMGPYGLVVDPNEKQPNDEPIDAWWGNMKKPEGM